MNALNAFVDEYGNSSLEVNSVGVSTFFIVTAVLVTGDVAVVRDEAEAIRKRFFQRGEMKSSGVGSNDARRILILEEMAKLNIRTYSLAIDKRELNRESGLAYKGSFFKYINKLLYSKIFRVYENVNLVADEHGGREFMRGFKDYIDKELDKDLFNRREFKFANSADEVLLQIADFTSGSFARGLDPGKMSPESKAIFGLLAKRSIGMAIWPDRSLPEPEQSCGDAPSDPHDFIIRQHCLRQVRIFIEASSGKGYLDEDIRLQVEVIAYLLFVSQYVDDQVFVSTRKIIAHLQNSLNEELTEHQIRSRVIAPLRDADVILASSRTGYKIPVRKSDIIEFVMHANAIIPPMIDRLRRAKNELFMASLGELDILDSIQFGRLRAFVESGQGG
jgi:Protein of unknown function (DUF3800)